MNAGDWRALIEAYLDGRLSAEAFARRFNDAWSQSRRAGERAPRAVAELQVVVEAFYADVLDAQEDGRVNDDEMREAARRARPQLDAAVTPTIETMGGPENIRAFSVQLGGCARVGCVAGLVWLALCLLQIHYVSEAIQHSFGWDAFPSVLVGVVIAFVPIVGNALAFLGATQNGWPAWMAAVVFFAAPVMAMLSGWWRWRRFR
ncbi:MAG TPA: hypothetical protein VG841_11570 [Caulobacterales bacterium]|nr:hypothetical protein [Caulobacterales bacterium]